MAKILIIDDDEELAGLMKEILVDCHHEVMLAGDGLRGVEQSLKHQIDLILLDIRMPYFSGMWFCNFFKQKPQTKNIPIVMISGCLDDENAEKARSLGAAACLKKPFGAAELLSVVQKNL